MRKIISALISAATFLAQFSAFAITGSGTAANPYLVSSASDLLAIHNDLGGYYRLTNNINMSGVPFTPIGNESEGAFTGTVDGDGYTISNLNINLPDNKYVGFIGYLEGTVKNLNVNGITANGYRYVGGIAGYADEGSTISYCSTSGDITGEYRIVDINIGGVVGRNSGMISNCQSTADITNNNGALVSGSNNGLLSSISGGICGYNKSEITNCTFEGKNTGASHCKGGITGYNDGGLITECTNNGTVTRGVLDNVGYGHYSGGVSGYTYYGTIANCINTGTISGYDKVGGISGYNNRVVISQCSNSGGVTGDSFTGGITGSNSGGRITNCSNSGSVAGSNNTGGISGESGTITGCINSGTVSGSHNTGGISGISGSSGTIKNCSNSGSVTGSKYTGGILGGSGGTIQNSINSADIKGSDMVGGISSYESYVYVSVYNCVHTGTVPSGYYSTNIRLTNYYVQKGHTVKMPIELYGYDGVLQWSSSNPSVATVNSSGVVTGKKVGTATITATTELGISTSATITVTEVDAVSITLNKTFVSLTEGMTEKLTATINPSDSTSGISWSSSDESIAKVSSSGIVTAVSAGDAVITVETSNGKKAYCGITVTEPLVLPRSISLDKTELTLTPCEQQGLIAAVLPENAADSTVTWISSNEEVAEVNDRGIVTGKSGGFAKIIASTSNGFYSECTVRVVSASGASVVLDDVKLIEGEQAVIKVNLLRNPGISAYKFTIDYNEEELTPVSITPNTAFGGIFTSNLEDSDRDKLNVLWYSNNNSEDDGELFEITFDVSGLSKEDETTVSLSYDDVDICNTAGNNIALFTGEGKITLIDPVPGDVSEDEVVTVYDLTLLSRYITGLESFSARQMLEADVNDDNEVDIKDVVTLAQYLVGWSGIKLAAEQGEKPEGSTRLTVGTASVNEAMEAEILVYIENNTGIAGFRYVIEHADSLEIMSITPTMDAIKDKFQTNLGQQGDNDLIVSWYDTDNMTDDGELFIIKARLTDPDADASQISIVPADNNMCDENKVDVIAEYEGGYVISDNCVKSNENITDTSYSCELYFDNTFEEQTASAILGFYDEKGKLVQLKNKEITVKPGKADLSFDIENKPYSTYKLMLWEGMNSIRPLVDVK